MINEEMRQKFEKAINKFFNASPNSLISYGVTKAMKMVNVASYTYFSRYLSVMPIFKNSEYDTPSLIKFLIIEYNLYELKESERKIFEYSTGKLYWIDPKLNFEYRDTTKPVACCPSCGQKLLTKKP